MSKKNIKKKKVRNEYGGPPKAAAKIPFIPIAIIIIAVMGIVFLALQKDKTGYVNVKDVDFKKTSNIESSRTVSNVTSREANFEKLKGGETKPVLSPARFTGKTASSYKVAQENPELMDHMYCFCYCKKTIGHKSLLSCFTDKHASNCTICQDQAFYAKILHDKSMDFGQVRKEVDRKFWRPFS
jgi:hypothetical protein